MSNVKEQYKTEYLKYYLEKNPDKNVMQAPKIMKVVLNRGLGEATTNTKCIEASYELMWLITGQKPVLTRSKKSISNFKTREGQVLGCKVTLRSHKMNDFLTKLINITLPKIRDFRGLSPSSCDKQGNYTFGIKEDLIFPETEYDKIDKIRGFDVTIVTNTNNSIETIDLLQFLGVPFRKQVKEE